MRCSSSAPRPPPLAGEIQVASSPGLPPQHDDVLGHRSPADSEGRPPRGADTFFSAGAGEQCCGAGQATTFCRLVTEFLLFSCDFAFGCSLRSDHCSNTGPLPSQAFPQPAMSDVPPSSPAPVKLPDDDDLLWEILLRLPPFPSSLPRASLVCKRWRRLLSDARFLRCFRAHHKTPPQLGFFTQSFTEPILFPTLCTPDHIPSARFSLPQRTGKSWRFLGCRHGFVAFLDVTRWEAVVWEPVTGRQCRIAFPPEVKFDKNRYIFNGAVLSSAGLNCNGHLQSDYHLAHFKLVLLFNNGEENLVCARLYESESGKWGDMNSIVIPSRPFLFDPGVLVRNTVCWHIHRGNILEFNLDTGSLSIIQKPEGTSLTEQSSIRVLRTEDRELSLAIVSKLSIQLWGRKANLNGVVRWVLQKTVQLDKLLPVKPLGKTWITKILGFDEDSNEIFLLTANDIFTIQLESMKFKELVTDSFITEYYPYRSFYAAGNIAKVIKPD
nr:unnamed protein product [Digitaria exilis]